MKGDTIKCLFRQAFGAYAGVYTTDENYIYLTTDRYFEKYVLLTDVGVYEVWAGGYRHKEDLELADFRVDDRFYEMSGLLIGGIEAVAEKELRIQFTNGSYFEIGLLADYNLFNHPERYMKFTKG